MPFAVPTSLKQLVSTILLVCGLCNQSTAQQFSTLPVEGETAQAGPVEILTHPTPVQSSGGPLIQRLQDELPPELAGRPQASMATLQKAKRFIPTAIDPELSLKLMVGRPKILQLTQAPKRIFTPSDTIIRPEIIDKDSGREIAVTGLQPGTTTLVFWFEDETSPTGQTTIAYEVQVFADPLFAQPTSDLEADLNEKFPNSYIELDEIAGRLIVRGQVPDVQEMAQILTVLSGSRGVRRNAAQQQQANTSVSSVTTFNAFPDDPLLREDEAALRRRGLDLNTLLQAGIVNQLKIVGEQQVMLKVTVAEVNRSAARSIGLDFDVLSNALNPIFSSTTGNLAQTANMMASLDMGEVALQIEALRRMNLSRTLAEPNLVALNGQSANFQAGGQFPIPVLSSGGAGGNNLQGVSFVPFGVQLQFIPLIQDRDVIQLQMSAEVSTRDESLGTTIGSGGGGSQVSGLNSRNFSTTVQLRSGQTIAVAGLLQSNFGASSDRIPLWGDLPIIGSTGGVNRTSSGEQELVILVTPHLVAPTDARESPALPGSDVHEPTDIEFFIANRLESRRSKDFRATVRTDYARLKRPDQCKSEKYMIGEVGPTDRCPQRPPVPHAAVRNKRLIPPAQLQEYPSQEHQPMSPGVYPGGENPGASTYEVTPRGYDVQ